MFVVKEWQN